jgi:hypothetical protein
MPIYTNKVLAGSQFTGTAIGDGLFSPRPGSSSVQVRVNSIRFHTTVAGTTLQIRAQNPDDAGDSTLLLSVAAADVYLDQLLLPTTGAECWPLVFTTTGMTGPGWLSVDYDFVRTEG